MYGHSKDEVFMEIKRDVYLGKIIRKQNNRLVKVITGIRRCGKSYLLFTQYKNYLLSTGVPVSHIIEMAFDAFSNEKYRDPEIFYPYVKSLITDEGMYYILLDEIQLLGKFEAVLNDLMRLPNVDLYVTGSNAKFLSKDVLTEFRGRGDEVYLAPLSFGEFMSAYDGNKYDGWNEYLLYGGLPPVVLLQSPEEKISFLKRLFEETYIKDVMGRNKLQHQSELEDLIDFLASSIGSLTNPSKLSDAFHSVKHVRISDKTIKKYLDSLCDAFLISEAKRYDVKGKKYFGTPLKYYFTDLGLRNARINFRQIEGTHSMENVIYNELVARDLNVDVGVVEVAEKNADKLLKKQLEIDFVCNKGSSRYYVQSAYSVDGEEKMAQEIRPFLKTGDSFKKILIVKDTPAPWHTEEGVLVLSIYDFLLNRNSLDL